MSTPATTRPRLRKLLRRSLRIVLVVFVLFNMVAAFHAWKFTHFRRGTSAGTRDEAHLSFSEKLSALFLGVSLPRPENHTAPATPFETVTIQSDVRLECWSIPAADIARGTVILCHGYGGAKAAMLGEAAIFRSLGYNVFYPTL